MIQFIQKIMAINSPTEIEIQPQDVPSLLHYVIGNYLDGETFHIQKNKPWKDRNT